MVEKKVIVYLKQGLQARNAIQFIQKTSSFNSEVSLIKQGKLVNGKSIMGVMSLAIRHEEEVTLLINGKDEEQAMNTIERLLNRHVYLEKKLQ